MEITRRQGRKKRVSKSFLVEQGGWEMRMRRYSLILAGRGTLHTTSQSMPFPRLSKAADLSFNASTCYGITYVGFGLVSSRRTQAFLPMVTPIPPDTKREQSPGRCCPRPDLNTLLWWPLAFPSPNHHTPPLFKCPRQC